MKILNSPFLKNLKKLVVRKRILSENFGMSKFAFEEDSDLKFSRLVPESSDLFLDYLQRMKGKIPLIILALDVGNKRMGLAVSKDMTGEFSRVDVLDTSRFRKSLKFIDLALDERTSLDMREAKKKVNIASHELAQKLYKYVRKCNVDGLLISYPLPRLHHVYQPDYIDSREYVYDFLEYVGKEQVILYLPYSFQNEYGTTRESQDELVKDKNKALGRTMTEREEEQYLRRKESRDWVDKQSAGAIIKRKFAAETIEGVRSRKIICKNDVCKCATDLESLVPKLSLLLSIQEFGKDFGNVSNISRAVLESMNEDVICTNCGVSIADHHLKCTECAHILCAYCCLRYLFKTNKCFSCIQCEKGFMEMLSIFPKLTKDLLETSKEMGAILNIKLAYGSAEKMTKNEMHDLESTLKCLAGNVVYY